MTGADQRLFAWPAARNRLAANGMLETRQDLQERPRAKWQPDICLKLRIHLHALRQEPRRYLTATWWHLRGKRVRARAAMAPLLAASPLAFQLWLRREVRLKTARSTVVDPSIVALVYGIDKVGTEDVASTLHSLASESIPAVVVDSDPANAAAAIDWSVTRWLMPIAAGDVLARGAGNVYRAAAATDAQIVFADDDLLSADGQRHSPHFKPTWNAELFHHFDYLTGTCIVRASADDLRPVSGSDWAKQLITKVAQIGGATISRVAHILHHRRSRPLPDALTAVAVNDSDLPSISVIVPTRNGLNLLMTCIEGLERTDYPSMEVIVVDNGSDDPATLAYLLALDPRRYKVLRDPGPFNFSRLNNHAAEQATGTLLCLLNNDIEIIAPDWLRIMAAQAMRPDVGAVGAQLLYPDGRIQHAGVVLGVGGGAAHAHRLLKPDDVGYHRRHALPQFVSAVTAACLVVQRARFNAVGGLDERNFAVAFNDVDLCMRLNERGWQSLYEPRARLIHHESVSRGHDRDPVGAARLARELAALKVAWHTDEVTDPFHHPELNRYCEHFAVRL